MILIPKYKNTIELAGSLSLVLTDAQSGEVRSEIYVPNLVVSAGKAFIASRMVGTASAVMSHMAIGTGSTAEAATETALVTELTGNNYSRAAVTATQGTVTSGGGRNDNQITYSANFPANNPNAPAGGVVLREAGIFNAASAGTMLCRTVYPTVTKLPADALTITWTITIS